MEEKKLFSSVFGWMFVGLLVTFLTGYYVSVNENMLYNVINNVTIIVIVELVIVFVLSALVHKMNKVTASILFILYAFVTGLTFSTIFIVYELGSIMSIFLVAALIFGIFAILGYKTSINLSKFSTIFMMILLGGIIVTIINLFLNNSMVDIIVSWVMLILFFGITAYDIQRIKRIAYQIDDFKRLTIICALNLYLDFINIFLRLLTLFGKSRD